MSGYNMNRGGPPPYSQQGPMGYPPQGYPPQGYPPQGYPPQGSQMGYPPPLGGQQGYTSQGPMGYPPQQAGQYSGGYGGTPAQGNYGNAPNYGGPPQMGYGYGPAPGNTQAMGGAYGPSGSYPASSATKSPSIYYSGRPTLVPQPNFDPGQDADELRKAMRGMGTNEERMIAILSKRTFNQRVEIAKKFSASFGKDLDKTISSELSGKFQDLVLMSIETLPGMLAASLFQAMNNSGTDEQVLLQALIPYPNAVISQIGPIYKKKYGREVVEAVRGDTSRDFEKILVAMLQAQREENMPADMAKAAADAEALHKAGEGRAGTEEAVFTRIFAQRSFEQIKAISKCYQEKYGKPLEKAIRKETSSDYQDVLVSIVRYAEDKNTLLAEWFCESMKGAGTHDKALMQLVLGRCEIDLQDVKEAYQRKYGKSLAKAIDSDTSGDYKKMLLALVGN